MAYVAVSGGKEAIEESIKLLDFYRSGSEKDLELEAIEGNLKLLVDKVMSEAGLYSPRYAALALKQSEGSLDEAVFLLRAYRSTLTRNYYTNVVNTDDMRIIRRISAAFKDIAGGQILGATYDYTHRLINFDIADENTKELHNKMEKLVSEAQNEEIYPLGRVSDFLREEGLIKTYEDNNEEPYDITENMLEFPAPRSARLQTLTRADSGYISGLAYSSQRGFGYVHPTVGELRSGYVDLTVPYLFSEYCVGEDDAIHIGEILITEVECFNVEEGKDALEIEVGYGAIFGRNENKAISMAILDNILEQKSTVPTQDEEFVLMHGDILEMNGMVSHLKLPHYVTFQSILDSVRQVRKGKNESLKEGK